MQNLKRIKEIQEEMEREELERKKRIEQSKRLQQGWELLRVCKDLMEMNGYKWKISKERREMERSKLEERHDRIKRAQKQKMDIVETERKKNIQRRITESLGELLRNRRILLERELELERRLLLKEAKEEVWKQVRGTNRCVYAKLCKVSSK